MSADAVARCYFVLAVVLLCSLGMLAGAQEQQLNVATLVVNSGKGDDLQQTTLLAIYGIGAILLGLHVPARYQKFLGWGLLLFCWCVASLAWSVNPDGTLRRLAALSGVVIIGTYAAVRFDLRDMIRLLTIVAAVLLVVSLAVGIADPSAGLDPEGRLRGVFHHKNSLGSFSAFALFTVGFRLMTRMDKDVGTRTLLGALCGLCLLCLFLSQSAGPVPSLLATVLVVLAMWAAGASDGRFRAVLPLVIPVGIAAVALLVSELGGADILGRESDLSGRTDIWAFAMMMIGERPWTGYGFGIFWLGANAPAAPFWKATYNFAPNAHNGFLELGLDAGVTAIVLLLAAIVSLWIKAVRLQRWTGDSCWYWVLGFVVFFCMVNLGEVQAWTANNPFTIIFVYCVTRTNIDDAWWRSRQRSAKVSAIAADLRSLVSDRSA